ncbi:GNAT family N-acetyltransferase [Hoeflea sp. TYP-13]|uniref:GNAT family N-acetyltransferase n=1 Tax=Hoeflea sp. TYP-13 TaxID=3230023 RepID=UPI0034C5FBA6
MKDKDPQRINCRFETERLVVAPWDESLGDGTKFAAELSPLLEPRVLKYLPAPLQCDTGPGAVERWIAARHAESDVFTVRASQTSDLLGLLILAPFPEDDTNLTIHLGYLFAECAWGKGYATELITGLVQWSAGQPIQIRFLGGVERGNSASAAVLLKAGFEKTDALSSDEADIYGLQLHGKGARS